jgi:hypothetical protein
MMNDSAVGLCHLRYCTMKEDMKAEISQGYSAF